MQKRLARRRRRRGRRRRGEHVAHCLGDALGDLVDCTAEDPLAGGVSVLVRMLVAVV